MKRSKGQSCNPIIRQSTFFKFSPPPWLAHLARSPPLGATPLYARSIFYMSVLGILCTVSRERVKTSTSSTERAAHKGPIRQSQIAISYLHHYDCSTFMTIVSGLIDWSKTVALTGWGCHLSLRRRRHCPSLRLNCDGVIHLHHCQRRSLTRLH